MLKSRPAKNIPAAPAWNIVVGVAVPVSAVPPSHRVRALPAWIRWPAAPNLKSTFLSVLNPPAPPQARRPDDVPVAARLIEHLSNVMFMPEMLPQVNPALPVLTPLATTNATP